MFILFGRIYKEIRLLCWKFVREKGGDSFSHGYCRASSLREGAFCLRKTKKPPSLREVAARSADGRSYSFYRSATALRYTG